MKNLERYLMFAIHGRKPARRPRRRRINSRGPVRDWKYRAWIRSLPCAACGSTHQVEAAHTGSDGGMAQKPSDTSCVPLCNDCHQSAPVSYHRNREAMGMDFRELVERLNAAYQGMAEYARGQE
jgi:hypothetical protein